RIGVLPAAVREQIDLLAALGRRLDSSGRLRQGDRGRERDGEHDQHAPHSRCSTQLRTDASALGRPDGSVPPACAMSARPPPFPPTCCATWLTSSPAFTLEVRSAVTPATRLTFPSCELASTIAADLSLSLSRSSVSRSAFASAPSSVAASTREPFTSTACETRSSPW